MKNEQKIKAVNELLSGDLVTFPAIPQGARGAGFDDSQDGEPDPWETTVPQNLLRWHCMWEGHTWIVYTPYMDGAKNLAESMICHHTGSADAACKVRESGYFDFGTCSIVDAQDGPTTFVDNRPTGRLYCK